MYSNELTLYCCLTYDLFTDKHVTPGIKRNNPSCEISSHTCFDINLLYKQTCDVLHTDSKKCILSSKIDYYKEYTVTCFNEHVKELRDTARHDRICMSSLACKLNFR